jgi:hypothetical protein
MLPNIGDGTVSELKKSRKKMGKTWGKFKRATGIKKSSDANNGMGHAGGDGAVGK